MTTQSLTLTKSTVELSTKRPIHYVNLPTATVTACGIILPEQPGTKFTVSRDLVAGECPTCDAVAHYDSKENAMTQAGIAAFLYSPALFQSTGVSA